MGSLHAVQPVIMQGRNSFELYGYDILIDEALTPWLLEVNASPSLTATDAEDHRLKFDMLDDLLTILDFEGYLTGRETRIGGFDLLWDDGPIWISYPSISKISTKGTNSLAGTKRLNIFLGARNDRVRQLQQLRCSRLKSWIATRSHSQERSMGNGLLHQEPQVRLLMAGYIKRKPCKTKAVGVLYTVRGNCYSTCVPRYI
ncbi:probable tubulin polyglutamylase TTLL9 [Cephus cinctus]|uniref:Tubulin--tyrosine ligase-like protein 9 n=1 Tax=Cephus cinctus TaxID=211228 RepID=A0AAJ7W688_CEPCN|nr:probable tubulin polyglutamylase TTLL9 [Cephus cinctus]